MSYKLEKEIGNHRWHRSTQMIMEWSGKMPDAKKSQGFDGKELCSLCVFA